MYASKINSSLRTAYKSSNICTQFTSHFGNCGSLKTKPNWIGNNFLLNYNTFSKSKSSLVKIDKESIYNKHKTAIRGNVWRFVRGFSDLPPHKKIKVWTKKKQTTESTHMENVAKHGEKAVSVAIVTNLIIFAGKLGAAVYTRSGSVLSEAVHSLADTLNQVLLYIGVRRSEQGPDKEHPYGHGLERNIYALISAVGVFFMGSGLSLYHGVSTLFYPNALESLPVAVVTLLISFLMESYSFSVAMAACRASAHELGMGLKDFLISGPDPMAVSVLLEDSAALIGVAVAALAVLLTYLTENPLFDSIGAIFVGILLAVVAVFLIRKNMKALVGLSIPPNQQQDILRVLQNDPVIRTIHNVTAVSLGTQIRFKAEADFNGIAISKKFLEKDSPDITKLHESLDTPTKLQNYLIRYGDGVIDQLGKEVDRIEEEIKKKVPEAQYVDIETH